MSGERPTADEHYDRLAGSYDEHWDYGPGYVPWMSARIAESLRLTPQDRIADIGCGTGLFAREVVRTVRLDHGILCVDPSPAMLREIGAPPPAGLMPFRASAEELAAGHRGTAPLPPSHDPLDALWLKEAVHHIADRDRPATLAGLARLLAPGGRLLVVMLPATISYPLFPEALRRYEELQPDPADVARDLTTTGLSVSVTYVEHELRIGTERYLDMVRNRYMSVLSTFDDAELEAGIAWMQRTLPKGELTFPDRFAFVLGTKDADEHSGTGGAHRD